MLNVEPTSEPSSAPLPVPTRLPLHSLQGLHSSSRCCWARQECSGSCSTFPVRDGVLGWIGWFTKDHAVLFHLHGKMKQNESWKERVSPHFHHFVSSICLPVRTDAAEKKKTTVIQLRQKWGKPVVTELHLPYPLGRRESEPWAQSTSTEVLLLHEMMVPVLPGRSINRVSRQKATFFLMQVNRGKAEGRGAGTQPLQPKSPLQWCSTCWTERGEPAASLLLLGFQWGSSAAAEVQSHCQCWQAALCLLSSISYSQLCSVVLALIYPASYAFHQSDELLCSWDERWGELGADERLYTASIYPQISPPCAAECSQACRFSHATSASASMAVVALHPCHK